MDRILHLFKYIGVLFMIYGALAFTGWGMTILDQIPQFSPVNWPLGTVSGVVQDSTGRYVASNTAYSRVQVYDPNLNFITGWSVDDGGGDFHLVMNKNDQVEVLCVRNHRRFVYNLDGNLVTQSGFSWDDYPNLDADTMTVSFPTPIYLLPFTSPFLGGFTVILGMIIISLAGWPIRRRKKKEEESGME